MKKSEIQTQSQEMLSRLIAFDADGRAVWPAEDLRKSIVRRLAWSPLTDLLDQSSISSDLLIAAKETSIQSAQDLLCHHRPPLELLRCLKDFAKQHYEDKQSAFPPEMLLMLYYGSIVVAMLRWNERITRLGDDDLRSGVTWVARQPWVELPLAGIFQEALQFLRSQRREWRA